ncbi:serine hydrolase domain-containing protein, partial [Desulfobacterales bacterium HSG16]|nr:serine hydrolase domain-containing protein [Desulfobacterales bacterium HSG16]
EQKSRFIKGIICFCALIIIAMTLAGCGDDGDNGKDGKDGQDGVYIDSPRLKSGLFLDSAVDGLSYVAENQTGLTAQGGMFIYEEGGKITFKIGDIVIGSDIPVKATMTPLDLVPGASDYKNTTVTNILRFLQTIDDDSNPDNGIVIENGIGNNETLDFSLSEADFAASAEAIIDRIFSNERDLVSTEDAQQHFRLTLLNIPGSTIDAEIRELLNEKIQTYEIPGVVMVITTPDGLEWTGRSGVSDIINNTSLTIGSKFRSGSVTKSFTGMATAQLVQEGLLNINDSLESWLPGIVPSPTDEEAASGEYTGYNANNITISDLLHHTSGLFNFTNDMRFLMPYYTAPETQITPDELVEWAVSNPPSSYPENPKFHYSNTNYVLLGMIIEKATGNSWESEIRRRFIEPLELTDTIVPDTGTAVIPGTYTYGYIDMYEDTGGVFGQENAIVEYSVLDASFTWSSGNMISTPADLTQWVRAIAEGKLLDTNHQNIIMTDMYPIENASIKYGFGLVADPVYDIVGHRGQIIGYGNAMQYHKGTHTAIAISANRTFPGGGNIQNAILLEALAILLDQTGA